MPRAAAFQARNYAAAGTLPPHRGVGMDGTGRELGHPPPPAFPGHGLSAASISLLISSPRVFRYVGKFAEEALRLKFVVEFGYIMENSTAKFPP